MNQYAMIGAKSQGNSRVHGWLLRIQAGIRPAPARMQRQNIDFTIVSAGLHFCIRHAFEGATRVAAADLPEVLFRARWGFRLVFPATSCSTSRDFKEDWVDYRKKRGYDVIFMGDGPHAASRADAVFAIKDLNARQDVH